MSIAVLNVAVALAAPEAACSLNGAMDEGECLCLPGWTGADCGVLDLRPAPPISGMHLPGTASWGASPLVVNQRPYHHRTSATTASAAGNFSSLSVVLFASTFANHCPLTSWLTNSRVQVTLPSNPLGPFRIQQSSTSAKDEVKTTPRRRTRPSPRSGVQGGTDGSTILLPTFHHNPSVVRLDDGTVVVYFIGNTNNGTFVKECAPAPPSGSGTSRAKNTPASRHGNHHGEKERRPAQRHMDVGGVTMVSAFNDHCSEVEMLLCEAIASQCIRAAWTTDNGATWSTSRCPVIAGRALRWDALVSNPSAVEVLVDAATGTPVSNGAKRASNGNDFAPSTSFKGGRNKSSNVTSCVYLAYRGHDLGKPELIGLAVSPMEPTGNTGRPSFLGPFERVVDTPLTNVRAEDPFLWVDKHMNMHMLAHAFGYPGQNSPYGLHFFAPPHPSNQTNGPSTFYTKWAASASPVYTPHVRYSNGTNATYERVERPQLLLDPATRTVPLVLYNGATFPDTGSWSFTLARPTSSFLAQ